jgi:hypothetical protein
LVSRNERAASGRSKIHTWQKREGVRNYFSLAAKLIINQDLLFSSSLLFSPTIPFPSLLTLFPDKI